MRRRLPNELCAEIVDAMHLKCKFEMSEKLKAQRLGICPSLDKFVLDSVRKSAITLTNCWDIENCNSNLALSDNALTITHKGVNGYGSVRSKLPVPRILKQGIFYFEITVKEGGIVNVGLSAGPKLPFIVGYSAGSCSYDDTGKFVVARKTYDYGPGYRPGDLIGCGVDLASNQLFFTQNGQFLGTATILPESDVELFPTITLLDSTVLETNFGQKPFKKFNFDPKILKMDGQNRWNEAEAELGRNLVSRAMLRSNLGHHNLRLQELMEEHQARALEQRRLEHEHRQLELDYQLMRRQFETEQRRLARLHSRLGQMTDKAGSSSITSQNEQNGD